jgi:hypothetical protein
MGRLQQKCSITNLFRVAFLLLKLETRVKTETIKNYNNMKTKISIFILVIGLAAFEIAHSAPVAGGSVSGSVSGSAGSANGSANGSAGAGTPVQPQPAPGTPIQPQPAPGTPIQPVQPGFGIPAQTNDWQNRTIPPQNNNGVTNWNGMNGTTNSFGGNSDVNTNWSNTNTNQ